MQSFITVTICIILLIALGLGANYSLRIFSEAVTPLTIHEPVPGVQCASLITSDGVAIDCWKIQ